MATNLGLPQVTDLISAQRQGSLPGIDPSALDPPQSPSWLLMKGAQGDA